MTAKQQAVDAHLMFAHNEDEDEQDKERLERKLKRYEDVGQVPGIRLEERTWWKLLTGLGVKEFKKF